jgi:hypothetical protein
VARRERESREGSLDSWSTSSDSFSPLLFVLMAIVWNNDSRGETHERFRAGCGTRENEIIKAHGGLTIMAMEF